MLILEEPGGSLEMLDSGQQDPLYALLVAAAILGLCVQRYLPPDEQDRTSGHSDIWPVLGKMTHIKDGLVVASCGVYLAMDSKSPESETTTVPELYQYAWSEKQSQNTENVVENQEITVVSSRVSRFSKPTERDRTYALRASREVVIVLCLVYIV